MSDEPISFADVRAARDRIRLHLPVTPLRRYPLLDQQVGRGIRVLVKHENFQPTGAFKVRNGVSALTALRPTPSGVVAATRGNHGLGLAWAGRRLGIPVTVCVPEGNNPEKNAAVRALGARLVEEGRDYDAAIAAADRLVKEEGLHVVHSTNDATVVAGAGTITLEILEEEPGIDALVFAVGGGSQAVGGITVARALRPGLPVYGVQAAGAAAIHDAWHLGRRVSHPAADTFADGLATRNTYPFTFGALRAGLAGFVTVTDAAIAEALRLLLASTHTLVEGAGAAGLAGLLALREELSGKTVAVVLSGANIDAETLRRVLVREI
ncbi:MAG: pyridoxal-phosphate dependent enzyme [Acidobacteria bacterium]|jgi:threonine dehydratase|nr:pyridoxal-phosphate dependent enzyme [Acidobacteriota bacterium]